jgi:hypothetical protein
VGIFQSRTKNEQNSGAVVGQVMFMIHIFCGWRNSSIAIMRAQAKAITSEIQAMFSNIPHLPKRGMVEATELAFSFSFMTASLQLRMLAYSLGLKDEAAFLDHLVIELESIQYRVVIV